MKAILYFVRQTFCVALHDLCIICCWNIYLNVGLLKTKKVNRFWSDKKNFGLAQTILGPVEGQGIHFLWLSWTVKSLMSEGSQEKI